MNHANSEGCTPLFLAALKGHLPVVELLLGRGAEVNHADCVGATPLYVAALKGHVPVVELLLGRGADVNQARRDGITPLFIASRYGHLPVVGLLLGRGADVNPANSSTTPLYIASHTGQVSVVELLLEMGAHVERRCGYNTPRMISELRGHVAISSRLAALEVARAKAREGDVEHFKEAVKAGVLPPPLWQWVPLLPLAVRAELIAWVATSIADERACFAALFHGPSTAPLRRLSNHQGVVSQALVELLVRRSPATRQLLRQLAECLREP